MTLPIDRSTREFEKFIDTPIGGVGVKTVNIKYDTEYTTGEFLATSTEQSHTFSDVFYNLTISNGPILLELKLNSPYNDTVYIEPQSDIVFSNFIVQSLFYRSTADNALFRVIATK